MPSVDLRGVQVDSPPRSPRSKPGPTPGGTSPQLLVTGQQEERGESQRGDRQAAWGGADVDVLLVAVCLSVAAVWLLSGAGGSVPSSPRRPNLMIDGRTTPRSGQGSSTSPPLTPNSPYSSNQHAMV